MCRSQRELSNAYFVANFGFDTAENEPFQVCSLSAYRSPRFPALAQLFSWESDEAPHIKLYPVGISIVPAGTATRMQISECVRSVPGHENDIVIGWVDKDGGLVLAPPPFEEHALAVGDCVCAVSRFAGEPGVTDEGWGDPPGGFLSARGEDPRAAAAAASALEVL